MPQQALSPQITMRWQSLSYCLLRARTEFADQLIATQLPGLYKLPHRPVDLSPVYTVTAALPGDHPWLQLLTASQSAAATSAASPCCITTGAYSSGQALLPGSVQPATQMKRKHLPLQDNKLLAAEER